MAAFDHLLRRAGLSQSSVPQLDPSAMLQRAHRCSARPYHCSGLCSGALEGASVDDGDEEKLRDAVGPSIEATSLSCETMNLLKLDSNWR